MRKSRRNIYYVSVLASDVYNRNGIVQNLVEKQLWNDKNLQEMFLRENH